jgi:di/tricarboxylate transporter
MTLAQVLVLAILIVPLALAVAGKLRADVAALSIAVLLGICQLAGVGMFGAAHTPENAVQAFSGFSQPAVITLIGLFVITRSLDQTGVIRWLAARMIRLGGQSEARLVVLFAGATALFSLIMNNVAAGALLLPGALETSRRAGVKPSKLLIPVAFGSLLGGMATYFTTANIVLSGLLRIAHPPQPALNMLNFLPTGGLIALAGILYLATLGRRLLPERDMGGQQLIGEITGRQLHEYFQLGERLWELQVRPGSRLTGQTLTSAGLGQRFGLTIPIIWRGRQAILTSQSDEVLLAGDILLVVGREERVQAMADAGLEFNRRATDRLLSVQGLTLAELMVGPHSTAIGKNLRELAFRQTTGFTVLALRRGERSYRTDVGLLPLELGDILLAVGSPSRLKALRANRAVLLLEAAAASPEINWRQAGIAVAVTLLAVAASIAGAPTSLSMFCGALLLVLSGVLSMESAYQSIEWQVIFQIAGMVALSTAMVDTGLSQLIGNEMIRLSAPFGPLGLAAGCFLLAALLTQVMGGQVTGLVIGPVAISSALGLGVNAQAIAVATAIGCSASFLTPLAHPVNLLMVAPGNYKFNDFFRAGWPLMIVCFVVLLAGLKLFWGF